MVTLCPNCGSDDLNLEKGLCRHCGQRLGDDGRASVPPTSQPEPPSDSEGPTIAAPRSPESVAAQLQARGDAGDWSNWEREVFNAYADGFRIITLIGFSAAGKTFFAQRLRRELRLSSDWTVSPGERSVIVRSSTRIEWTEIVRHGRRPRKYLLADVDGEAYRSSLVHLAEASDDTIWRRYVLLTALASAYVMVLPARGDLTEVDEFETEKLVDRFDAIVGAMLALNQRMRTASDVRDAVKASVTPDDVRKALRDDIQCPQPVHVLFAKADTFADLTKHEADPYTFAMRHARTLYRTIDKHFATHRFDFVSAFHGYQENPGHLVDYKCPTYGTLAAFEWIDHMASGGILTRKATAAAKAARRLLDSSFRRNVTGVPVR